MTVRVVGSSMRFCTIPFSYAANRRMEWFTPCLAPSAWIGAFGTWWFASLLPILWFAHPLGWMLSINHLVARSALPPFLTQKLSCSSGRETPGTSYVSTQAVESTAFVANTALLRPTLTSHGGTTSTDRSLEPDTLMYFPKCLPRRERNQNPYQNLQGRIALSNLR